MKKLVLSLAILVGSSFTILASNDNKTNCENNSKACTECVNKDGKSCKKERGIKNIRAFEGLNLTTEQQTKLEALQNNFAKERKASKQAKEANKKDKDSKKNLTYEQKKQMKEEKRAKRLEAKKQYLAGIKSILTPEQYNKFLENNYLSKGEGKSSKGKGYKMQGKRGDKKMGKRSHGDKKLNGKRDGNTMTRKENSATNPSAKASV